MFGGISCESYICHCSVKNDVPELLLFRDIFFSPMQAVNANMSVYDCVIISQENKLHIILKK